MSDETMAPAEQPQTPAQAALARVRAALVGTKRGITQISRRQVKADHVGVMAPDLVLVCDLVPEADRDQNVKDLRLGASRAGDVQIGCFAEHVYQVVDKIKS